MARLVLLSEGLSGRTFVLKGAKTTVGRVPDNDFQIPEASVSSHHCELHLQGKDLLVKDLESTNGTFINGERVTETLLKAGQILRLGMIEMRLFAIANMNQPLGVGRIGLDKIRMLKAFGWPCGWIASQFKSTGLAG